MGLASRIESLHDYVSSQKQVIQHNTDLFDIYEGDLLKFVLEELKQQISIESFNLATKRIPPINILSKLTDKLSQIYQQSPTRSVIGGTEKDDQLLTFYQKSMDLNSKMNSGNENYNLYKNTLLQPYIFKGTPRLRSIPSNCFTVFSDSQIDPNVPTGVMTFHRAKSKEGKTIPVYYVYTDEEFLIFDDEKNIRTDLMAQFENDGKNIFKKIPFVYVNQSKNLLIPKIDSDIKKMVVLLPVMLADLNFAVMMQAFSIIYGIDIDNEGIKMSPNAFWKFKSDPTNDKTPQIGVLKPSVDIEATLNLIQAEVGLWLETKGLKASSVGKLTADNYASGISKMIDNVDTSEERQKQVAVFQNAESELWDLIINHMHPVWRSKQVIETSLDFTKGVSIQTNFCPQLPIIDRGKVVEDLDKEVKAGFISRQRAIQKLNPSFSQQELDELMAEIEDEAGQADEADQPDEDKKIEYGSDEVDGDMAKNQN